MPTIREHLTQAIATAEAELLRIQTNADEQTAKVTQRLTALKQAQAGMTEQIDAILGGLEAVGVKITFEAGR